MMNGHPLFITLTYNNFLFAMLGNPQYNVGLDRRKKNLEKIKNTGIIRELVCNLYKETNNLENFGQIFYDAQNNIQFFQE